MFQVILDDHWATCSWYYEDDLDDSACAQVRKDTTGAVRSSFIFITKIPYYKYNILYSNWERLGQIKF